MLRAIFGAELPFESSFVSGLHALTEGNPFFVEEVLKSLLVVGRPRARETARGAPARWSNVRVPRTATEAVGTAARGA